MKTFSKNMSYAFFLLILFVADIQAFTIAEKAEVLKNISGFANEICNKIELEGEFEKTQITGNIKAGLDSFLKKIVEVKGSLDVDSLKKKWKGITQDDLPQSLKTSSDCKLKIVEMLKNDIETSIKKK